MSTFVDVCKEPGLSSSSKHSFDPRRPANAPPTKGGRLPPQRSRHKGRRSQRGPCEGVTEPPIAKAAWWTYVLQKTEHTGRRSQRGQCEDEYQHHGDHTRHHGIYNQHHLPNQYQPCPCRMTTYSSSSQGSGNSSSSILISTKSRACRILASRVRGGSGDTDTTRPQGDTNDFNSSAKKDRQTTVKATTEGPSSSATAGDHGAVGKRNSPVIGILRRGKNWTRTCGIRTTHRPRCGYRGSGASTWAAKAELVLLVAGVR